VIFVAALDALSVVIRAEHRLRGVEFSAWIVASALGVTAAGDGQSYMTSHLSHKTLMIWSFLSYLCKRVCALPSPRAELSQPVLINPIFSLAAGDNRTVPVSSYIHPPSASAKQAYSPPV